MPILGRLLYLKKEKWWIRYRTKQGMQLYNCIELYLKANVLTMQVLNLVLSKTIFIAPYRFIN